jgi:hypothetical protein
VSKKGNYYRSTQTFSNDDFEAELMKTDEEYHYTIKEDFDGNYNLVGEAVSIYLVIKDGKIIGQIKDPSEYKNGKRLNMSLRELSKHSMWFAADHGLSIHKEYGYYVGRVK